MKVRRDSGSGRDAREPIPGDNPEGGRCMKRTAGAFTLLAALGGCMSTHHKTEPTSDHFGRVGHAKELPGAVGPWGQPVAVGANGVAAPSESGVIPVSVRPAVSSEVPGGGGFIQKASYTGGLTAGVSASQAASYGRRTGQVPPPPYVGPPGAVAAVGAMPGGMPPMANSRSSVRFLGQDGMKVSWLAPTATGIGFSSRLEVPGRYNFLQGAVYRLKLSDIPKRPGLELYPTIEVVSQNPKTTTYLAHSAIPLTFTDDDFEQVVSGNFVVKVVYLPDPQFQDLATAGPDEVVSTRLDPGVDPVQEAQRRGSVMLIVRMGNIDLEAPNTPGMEVPNPYMRGPGPGMMPGPMPGGSRGPMPGMKPMPGTPPAVKPMPATAPNPLPAIGSSKPDIAVPLPRPSGSVVLP